MVEDKKQQNNNSSVLSVTLPRWSNNDMPETCQKVSKPVCVLIHLDGHSRKDKVFLTIEKGSSRVTVILEAEEHFWIKIYDCFKVKGVVTIAHGLNLKF